MLLLEPQPTPGDLRFQIFGTPVRVHPMFWLMTALLGWNRDGGLAQLLIWILCVFVSILIHELGHVWTGLIFGSRGHIVLFSFGGLAIGSKDLSKRWQRIAVSAAGPLIQFIPYGIARLVRANYVELVGIDFAISNAGEKLYVALWYLMVINLFWPLLNLLPIWPLDGGQIARELFEQFQPRRGVRTALGLSLLVAGFLAINALVGMARDKPLVPYLPVGGYTAILFGLLAFSNYQELQQSNASNPWGNEGAPWDRDPDSWRR